MNLNNSSILVPCARPCACACVCVCVWRAVFFTFRCDASSTTWPAHGGGVWRRHEARAFRLNSVFFICSRLAAAERNRASLWVRSVSCRLIFIFHTKTEKIKYQFSSWREIRRPPRWHPVQQNPEPRTQNTGPSSGSNVIFFLHLVWLGRVPVCSGSDPTGRRLRSIAETQTTENIYLLNEWIN